MGEETFGMIGDRATIGAGELEEHAIKFPELCHVCGMELPNHDTRFHDLLERIEKLEAAVHPRSTSS